MNGQSLDSSSFIQLGPYSGIANYQYIVDGKDTLLDGSFELKGVKEDLIEKDQFHSFHFRGQYFQNRPDEIWDFEFGDLTKDGKAELSTYRLESSTSGKLHKAKLEFNEGKLNGTMLHQLYRVEASKISDPYFESQLNFENGELDGEFIFSNPNLSLSAEVNQGLASGIWLFKFEENQSRERWNFTNGSLNSIEWQSLDSSFQIKVFDQNHSDSVQMELSKKTLDIISLHLSIEKKEALNYEVEGLIQTNDELIVQMEEIVSQLGAESHHANPLINIPFYPLTSAEEKQLKRIRLRLNQSDSIQMELKKNYQIRVLRNTNDSLRFYLEAQKIIENELLSICKTLLSFEEDSLLPFLPRTEIDSYLGIDELPIVFSINFKKGLSRELKLASIETVKISYQGIAALDQLSELSLTKLKELNFQTNKILNRYQKGKELELVEEQLVKKQDAFENFMDSLLFYSSDPYRYAIASIKNSMIFKLNTYWSKGGDIDRLSESKSLLACMNSLDGLVLAIADMPRKKSEVEKVYTVSMWNAFTYTSMTEIVKKKIYNTYANILLPYFLNEVEENFNCSRLESLKHQINDTHYRMLELKEERTGKLEKKLSKNLSPQEALLLLKIVNKEEDL